LKQITSQILLFVLKDKSDQIKYKNYFKNTFPEFHLYYSDSVLETKKIVKSNVVDVLISDFYLNDGTARSFLRIKPEINTIILLESGDEHLISEILNKGASEYIVKDKGYNFINYLHLVIKKALQNKSNAWLSDLSTHLISNIDDSVFVADTNGKIVFVNSSFCKNYGFEEREIIGKNIDLLWQNKKDVRLINDKNYEKLNGEFIHVRKNGSELKILIKASPSKNSNNNLKYIIFSGRDISNEKIIHEEIEKAEKLKTVREIAGAVSHEISQPLQALTSSLSLLQANPQKTEYIQKSSELAKKIAQLVNDLRRITSIQKQDYLSTQIIDIKSSAKPLKGEFKILVVDDESSVLTTLVESVQLLGYSCDGAKDGLEALQLLKNTNYHLIISDINMPRMPGPTLFRNIKEIGHECYFIFLTGYAVPKEIEGIIKEADGLLNKPIDLKDLQNILQKFESGISF